MATTVLYRISSNEVLKISPKGQPFSDRDTAFFGVLIDPPRPDGDVVRETLPDGTLGPMRTLGFAKINDTGTVRNATQPEIDAFAAPETDDGNQLDASQAQGLIDLHPLWRKIWKAVLKRVISENNTTNQRVEDMITQWNQHKVDVASASNLSKLKSATAALPTISPSLPQRTLPQAVTALKNDVDKND